ncbi:MAG: S-layer homology domain-containing protein [Oscillospiraceae bacterium]|nr:S-layer homology domain-containing protein [Oscillospiraceae bacterium]
MRTLKKALCIVLALVMAVGLLTVAAGAKSLSDYSDADKVSDEYALAVDANTQLGVLKGMTDATYEPQGTLNRAQLATIIYRIVTGDVEDKYVANYANAERFSDVPTDAWFAGYVNFCADNGYLKGVGDGKYDPAGTLTGYQAMAALLRAIGYDKNHVYEGNDWYVAVTKDATAINKGIKADWAQPISREVAAQLAWNTLVAAPVMWVAALGEYIGLPADYAAYAGVMGEPVSPVAETLGLVPLLYSVFGADYSDYDFVGEVPAYVLYDEDDNALVTLPIEAVKTYNTKIDICDLLVDAGIPKTSTAKKTFVLWQNGRYIDEIGELTIVDNTAYLTHAGLACTKEDDLHGQGVVTNLFDLSKLQNLGLPTDRTGAGVGYLVTQTWYYLAKVTDVADDAHGSAGAVTVDVWCQGAGKDPISATISETYPVGTWLIVHDDDTDMIAIEPEDDVELKAINDAPKFARAYMPTAESVFVVDYEPTTISGQLAKITDNQKEAKIIFNINKKDYDLNIDYYMSDAMAQKDAEGNALTTGFANKTFTWFLDKFGNIIGDIEEVAATGYAVVDRIAYYAKELDDGYAAANLVYMDASKDPAFKLTAIWNEKPAVAEGEEAKPGYFPFENGDAYEAAVSMKADPAAISQDWKQNGDWEAPLYILAGTKLKPVTDTIENATITKGIPQIAAPAAATGDDSSVVNSTARALDKSDAIYANDKTVFLYRTGTRGNYEYASYTGITNAPSVKGVTVYYAPAKTASAFASVIFVDASTATGDGSKINAIIPAGLKPDSIEYVDTNGDKIPLYTFTLYDLNGNTITVQATNEDEAKNAEDLMAQKAGIYELTLDADGYYVPTAKSLTEGDDSKYEAVTVAEKDVYAGLAFYHYETDDTSVQYNFKGANIIVIGKKVTTTTADKADKYFTYTAASATNQNPTNYMFYVLKDEATKQPYSVVYVMEAPKAS